MKKPARLILVLSLLPLSWLIVILVIFLFKINTYDHQRQVFSFRQIILPEEFYQDHRIGFATVEITPLFFDSLSGDGLPNHFSTLSANEFYDRNGNGVFDGLFRSSSHRTIPIRCIDETLWATLCFLETDNIKIAILSFDGNGISPFLYDLLGKKLRAGFQIDFLIVMPSREYHVPDLTRQRIPPWSSDLAHQLYQDYFIGQIREAALAAEKKMTPFSLKVYRQSTNLMVYRFFSSNEPVLGDWIVTRQIGSVDDDGECVDGGMFHAIRERSRLQGNSNLCFFIGYDPKQRYTSWVNSLYSLIPDSTNWHRQDSIDFAIDASNLVLPLEWNQLFALYDNGNIQRSLYRFNSLTTQISLLKFGDIFYLNSPFDYTPDFYKQIESFLSNVPGEYYLISRVNDFPPFVIDRNSEHSFKIMRGFQNMIQNYQIENIIEEEEKEIDP